MDQRNGAHAREIDVDPEDKDGDDDDDDDKHIATKLTQDTPSVLFVVYYITVST